MSNKMMLPHLNGLRPTKETTFKKLVEEISECNEAIEDLREFEEDIQNKKIMTLSDEDFYLSRQKFKKYLQDVLGEIMDVAQVCATQLFVFQAENVDVAEFVKNAYSEEIVYSEVDGIKYFYLDPKYITVRSVDNAMRKIITSMGKIAQLGKYLGESGEIASIEMEQATKEYITQLFKIIGYSYSLLHILNEKYHIDTDKLFKEHVEKLELRGYLKKMAS